MKSLWIRTALVALVATYASTELLAHGGAYNGPAGGGSGNPGGGSGGGSTGGGGGGGGGGGTTGSGGGSGGGGTTGGGGGSGPGRPGGRNGGGGGGTGSGNRGTTPGARPRPKNDGFLEWTLWWELNDDRFLSLKAALAKRAARTANIDTVLGENDGAPLVQDITRALRSEIEPVLRIGAKDAFWDASAASLIALGKLGGPDRTDLCELLSGYLTDPTAMQDRQEIREAAVLGLGILGNSSAAPLLLQIYRNDPERRLKGKDHPSRLRSFAAMAIGLIGSRDRSFLDAAILQGLVGGAETAGASEDLQVGAVVGLGVFGDPAASPALLRIATDAAQGERVRAHAVVALGKLGDRASVKVLRDLLSDRRTEVRRSAAVALGLLVDREDVATIDRLIEIAKSGSDLALRHFALIALGEIGAPRGRDVLVSVVREGNSGERTFAALALGVYGQKRRAECADLAPIVMERFRDADAATEKSGYAIALGMLGTESALRALEATLTDPGSSLELRGYVAIACGLIDAPKSRPALAAIQTLAKSGADLDAAHRAAVALGLCGDTQAVPLLGAVLKQADGSLAALGSAAQALGLIGDRRAVAPLGDILLNKDGTAKDNARAFAAVGLGLLADKDAFTALSRIQQHVNYFATTEAFAEVLTIH